MKLVKVGSDENLIANADFSGKHILGWSTNWNGPSFSLAYDSTPSTGIASVLVATMKLYVDDAYYTLQGMKVLRPTKGIYFSPG